LRPALFRVGRNLLWLGFGEVALKGALFGAGVVVARGLGPEGMGAFTVAYGAALVLMQVLASGQVEVLIRETARSPEHGRALFLLARSHQWRVAAVVLPLAVVGAVLVPRPDLRWSLLAFVPYAFLRRWLITGGAVFKGLDRMDVEVRGRILELVVALPFLVVVSSAKWPVWWTGLAFSAGGVAGVAWITMHLRRLPLTSAPPLPRAALAREGAPFLGVSIVNQLLMRADSFLLASLGVPAAQIGRYGVAGAPAQGLNAASQMIAVSAYPTLARSAANATLRPRFVLLLAAGGATLGTMLGSVLFVLRRPVIAVFFGPEYATSADLLGVLAWVLPGGCTSMMAGAVLASLRRQRWPLVSQSIMLVLSVTANLLVIPRYGIAGCAVVALCLVSTSAVTHTTMAVIAARLGLPAGGGEPAFEGLPEGQD
jgi:O-antigen/teichoic acid export membrane protein